MERRARPAYSERRKPPRPARREIIEGLGQIDEISSDSSDMRASGRYRTIPGNRFASGLGSWRSVGPAAIRRRRQFESQSSLPECSYDARSKHQPHEARESGETQYADAASQKRYIQRADGSATISTSASRARRTHESQAAGAGGATDCSASISAARSASLRSRSSSIGSSTAMAADAAALTAAGASPIAASASSSRSSNK